MLIVRYQQQARKVEVVWGNIGAKCRPEGRMAGWTVCSLEGDFVGSNSTGWTHRVGSTGMVELDIVAGEAAAGAALVWDVLTGRTHSTGCGLGEE